MSGRDIDADYHLNEVHDGRGGGLYNDMFAQRVTFSAAKGFALGALGGAFWGSTTFIGASVSGAAINPVANAVFRAMMAPLYASMLFGVGTLIDTASGSLDPAEIELGDLAWRMLDSLVIYGKIGGSVGDNWATGAGGVASNSVNATC